jgi:hypothetical protein
VSQAIKNLNVNHIEWLKKHGACSEGLSFARKYQTPQAAWDACKDLNYLKWVACASLDDEYRAKCASLDDGYLAKCAPIDDEYRAKLSTIAAARTCDELRATVACPEVSEHTGLVKL